MKLLRGLGSHGAWLGTWCLIALSAQAAHADSIYNVTIDSSGLVGQSATLAFDFIAGGGTQENTLAISKFVSDGTLGVAGPNSGSVSGSLSSGFTLNTMSGSSFFNEDLQAITLGSTLSFEVDATTNTPANGVPDAFSFFIVDPSASNSLLQTSDPTGANSLFFLEVNGTANGNLSVYSTTQGVTARLTPVPLPVAGWLLLSGLSIVGVSFKQRRPI